MLSNAAPELDLVNDDEDGVRTSSKGLIPHRLSAPAVLFEKPSEGDGELVSDQGEGRHKRRTAALHLRLDNRLAPAYRSVNPTTTSMHL